MQELLEEANSKTVQEAADILKALSHPARLMIIKTLMERDCSVGNLEDVANLSQSGVSQHLRILRLSGIIEPHRKGKEICYKIVDERVKDIVNIML